MLQANYTIFNILMSRLMTRSDLSFTNLGLTDQHSLLYFSLLELGKATYMDLAKKTGIPRSSCYEYIPDLVKLGLVSEVVEGKKRFLIAESPEKLFVLLKEKGSNINNDIKKFEGELPSLLSQFNSITDRPSVKFYKGVEGIKTIFDDTLKEKEEMLVLCQGDRPDLRDKEDPKYLADYIKEFKKNKCKSREIIEDRGTAREYLKKYGDEDQKIKLSPPLKRDDMTHIDKIVYGNKVAIIAFDEERAVLIEDKYMALNERVTFDVLWNALEGKHYNYKKPDKS
jgi:sugar-specific transcriptional regulator TrmB